jgi:small-conductance mechanosensitive channel
MPPVPPPPVPPAIPPADVSSFPDAAWIAVVLVVALAALAALRAFGLRLLHGWAKRTDSAVDDLLVTAVRGPSVLWVVTVALSVTVRAAPMPEALREPVARTLDALVLLSVSLTAANVAAATLEALVRRTQPSGEAPALARFVGRFAVLGLGVTLVLNALGVEIAPILTALGVGGLAVALALQETLGNLFAGVHLLLEQPFRVGDYVRLEDGRQGTVHDVGWRTTRLRTVDDDVLVVPNSKIAGSQLLNYHLLYRPSRVALELRVPLDAPAERVEAALLRAVDAGRARFEILADPAPDALLVELGDWAQRWRLRFWIDDAVHEPRALDAVNRAALLELAGIGVPLATPRTDVRMIAGSGP